MKNLNSLIDYIPAEWSDVQIVIDDIGTYRPIHRIELVSQQSGKNVVVFATAPFNLEAIPGKKARE